MNVNIRGVSTGQSASRATRRARSVRAKAKQMCACQCARVGRAARVRRGVQERRGEKRSNTSHSRADVY